jgi:hypothetical protein
MTDTVLLWVLVAVLLVAVLAVAAALRLRNRNDLAARPGPAAEPAVDDHATAPPAPVDEAASLPEPEALVEMHQPAGAPHPDPAIPLQRSAGTDVPASAPTPPSGMVAVLPGAPAGQAATDPAMAGLEPRTPARSVAAMAADVLADSLRREGPFAGSVLPNGDGTTASDPAYRIKASTATRRYYRPESPHYPHAPAQLWFRTAADAERAGFIG